MSEEESLEARVMILKEENKRLQELLVRVLQHPGLIYVISFRQEASAALEGIPFTRKAPSRHTL